MTTKTKAVAGMLAMTMLSTGPALAQVNKSNQNVPFFLEGPAAALAAKMLFICGGGGTGAITGPVRYKVTVKNAEPAAPLTLSAGGIPQATVVASNGGSAKFVFGANGAKGLPLDFDPRDHEIEITDDNGHTLSSENPDGSHPAGTRIDERVRLNPTGVVPAASGGARLRERKGVRDFDVQVEDLPDGAYDLIVAGVIRGTITVTGGRGAIDFASSGNDPDELPLDFDPLGAVIQVAQGSDIVLTGTVLAGAPGVSMCTPSEASSALGNVGSDPDASGDTRFRVKSDCDRDFQVEVEDLPIGAYEVVVGGVVRGTIDVVDDGGDIKGEIEFDSDADDPDEVLLDFDPIGQTVEIRQGTTVFLSSTVGTPGPGTCGVVDDEPDLDNLGVDPDADGKARFRQDADCERDFRVEAEDLAVGSYELVVGGIVRGSIDVADIGAGDTQGELEFDDDAGQVGKLLLDFDPRGQLVEVRQGTTVFLSVTMPD